MKIKLNPFLISKTYPNEKFRKVFSKGSPMGRWVDGGSAGARPPPLLSVRTLCQMCTTISPLQRHASTGLPFPSLPFPRSAGSCPKWSKNLYKPLPF